MGEQNGDALVEALRLMASTPRPVALVARAASPEVLERRPTVEEWLDSFPKQLAAMDRFTVLPPTLPLLQAMVLRWFTGQRAGLKIWNLYSFIQQLYMNRVYVGKIF